MLQVKNWNKFQHYKDRNPPWIKLATDTFQNYEFSKLSDASKLLAICIWTLASRTKDGELANDFEYIKRQCNLGDTVKPTHLKELINHGFIVDASNALADCKQSAIPETEGEGETEKRQTAKEKFIKSDLSELNEWFLKNAPSVNKEKLREKILDWCSSKGKTYKDYFAAMRTWATKEHEENVKRGWVKTKAVNLNDPFAEVMGGK